MVAQNSPNESKIDMPLSHKLEFHVRESPLTRALRETKAARGVYSATIATCLFVFAATTAQYFIFNDVWQDDVRFLSRVFDKFWILIAYEICIHIGAVILIFLPVKWTVDKCQWYKILLLPGAVFLLVFPVYVRLASQMHEAQAAVVVFEQIRFLMMTISFVVETSGEKAQPVSLSSFVYFLFAPTCVYRHEYPRKKARDFVSMAWWSLEVLMLMWMGLIVTNHGLRQRAELVGKMYLTPSDYFDLFVKFAVFAPVMIAAIAYGFLHCWLNIWAEILLFGDRMFYKNWLVTTSLLNMFKLWNYVVHSWIGEYMYKPILRCTGSRMTAAAVSFLMSFLVHDYAVCLPARIVLLQFTLSVVFISLLLPILYPITKLLSKLLPTPTYNIHVFFIQGTSIIFLVTSTTVAAYARVNCKDFYNETTLLNVLDPYTPIYQCLTNLPSGNSTLIQ